MPHSLFSSTSVYSALFPHFPLSPHLKNVFIFWDISLDYLLSLKPPLQLNHIIPFHFSPTHISSALLSIHPSSPFVFFLLFYSLFPSPLLAKSSKLINLLTYQFLGYLPIYITKHNVTTFHENR